MIELSGYVFEVLRKDEDFVLYRGWTNHAGSQVLVPSPVAEYPAPVILKWLEHAYSLREELDPTWAGPTDWHCLPLGPYGTRIGGSRRCTPG